MTKVHNYLPAIRLSATCLTVYRVDCLGGE